jgi:hypothetical protein
LILSFSFLSDSSEPESESDFLQEMKIVIRTRKVIVLYIAILRFVVLDEAAKL